MNHSSARAAVDELFVGRLRRTSALRVHLDGCLDCRGYYDRTARGFRALVGKPEEMTAAELRLFEPAFPFPTVSPVRRLVPWFGLAAVAAAALAVVLVQTGPAEFTPRGGENKVGDQPVIRPLCSRQVEGRVVVGDPATGTCAKGDRLAFVATGHGRRFLALAVFDGEQVEWLVTGAEGALTAADVERVLPTVSTWRPGLRAVAIFGAAPIDPTVAEPCAKGSCPASLERSEIPLVPR